MEKYKEHVENAAFIIKVFEFIIAILCGLAFIIVIVVCFAQMMFGLLWPALLAIPAACVLILTLLELFRHIYLSFVLKTDYCKPQNNSTIENEEHKE